MTRANSLFPEGLLFASGNRNKYTEVVDLFAPLGIRILFGPDLLTLDVEETGNTYMSNARLKAREWALKAGIPALADDSGVEVRALGWKPGIFSARIAPDDPGRVHWMLDAMKNREDRYAKYVAAFALFFPREYLCLATEGECHGEIVQKPAGNRGFGYDPIFTPFGFGSTFGEIPDAVKRKISHRAVAGYRLMDILS
ncbi:non-canonical purine NTP pyrophosphatase [Aminivibrio sp.]|uniref:non-canonical purine NTP pyrophosphatase n=1 Tax=Aminivibrio sp. TaxID=1872489 RepID=UPI001D48887E|nr:non-canonical purine NTP pyrophosphatase [Synergistaceae bacterium]NCC57472.1 non-canonical purine NTP pyrophosphatase [Synergistales bacterium]